MLLSIRHETSLSYSARISETVMELRMAPKSDAHQTLRGFGLAVGPAALLFEHVDWLGNSVHSFSIVEFHERVLIVAESVVDVHRKQPAIETLTDRLPFEVADHRLRDFLRFQGPISEDARLGELARALGLDRSQNAGELLSLVARTPRERFRYQKGVTSSTTRVSEMLDHEAGVCQDFAHLAIALFRQLGVPARYVSGYLQRSAAESELETHAWCEAFVPSAGWVAIDPTHGQLADDQHIAVGIGRSFADVPPNRGVFRGDATESIKVSVTIEPAAEVPAGLLAPRPAPLDVPAFADGSLDHKEEIDYQQEQQQQQQQQ